MKSSIKVDITLSGNPVINILAFDDWNDLRDKTLNMFLNELSPHGRLCFIDSSGSKNSGSAGNDGVRNYTITAINPENYELLLKEVQRLIEERNSFYENSEHYAKENNKKTDAILKEQNEFEFRKRMNY